MSAEKSTIDRTASEPRLRSSTVDDPSRPASPTSTSTTPRPGASTEPSEKALRGGGAVRARSIEPAALPAHARQRRIFGLLERRSPAIGGWLAERLWFRLPAGPDARTREARTPRGGEDFAVTWRNGTVRGRVYGDWGNPTAYLVHGWGGWWQQLSAHVAPLVEAGMCVVAFDAPSHGGSDRGAHGPSSTTFVEMGEALAAVVAEFGRPTVVLAHSAGSLAAVHALRLGVDPDSLVLVAPRDGVEGMLPAVAGALGVGPRSQQVMVRRAERRVGVAVPDLDLLSMAARHASLPHLLVIHDREDREAPLAGAVRITDAWHGARLTVTGGLGHRRVLWDPAVVVRVTAFATAAAERVRRSSR